MHRIWIGVDGGGTRTTVLAGDQDEAGSPRVRGRGEAGPSNPQAVGFDTAAETLATAISAALINGEIGPAAVRIARVTLGIAGASRPGDRARLNGLLAARLGIPVERVEIVADIALLLPAAGLHSGVALIAGTGSAAYGVSLDGRTALAGGWGYLLGDAGSGFAVGREALRAVLRADDGLGPDTALAGALASHLGVSQPRDLIRAIYQSDSPRGAVATLAPLVTTTASAGDPVAQRILERAGRDLGQIARAVARRVGLGPEAVVVGSGGMFRAGDLLVAPLRADLVRAGLADFRLLAAEPALGALRLAMAPETVATNPAH